MKKHAWALLYASLALTACGELTFKRGAGQDSLNAARQQCMSGTSDRGAYEKCMNDQGWMVQRLDTMDLDLAVDPVAKIAANADNRTPATADAAAPLETASPTPADPLDRFVIGSWWKSGGNPDILKAAMSGCVARLGEEHRPAPGSKEFTRGMLLCLREQGWYGVQEK